MAGIGDKEPTANYFGFSAAAASSRQAVEPTIRRS
jgi:hypothetical protein